MDQEKITLRRQLEQAIHYLTEAKSVIENEEDVRLANNDVRSAADFILNSIHPRIQKILESQKKEPTY